MPLLKRAGAAVALRPSAYRDGTVGVTGNRATPPDSVPSIVVAGEQYNVIARLAAAGKPVSLRVELRARYFEEDRNSYNVIAEIPGTDPALRDQVVLVGAHLDSWHTGTGATDNADGAVAVMEAMRILRALGAGPRRTIRAALWSGEEQGLLGARAYVAQHFNTPAARDQLAVYLNDDPGSGRTLGFYMEGNKDAKAIFDRWLAPLKDLGRDAEHHRRHRRHGSRAVQRGRTARLQRHQGLPRVRRAHAAHQRRLSRAHERGRPEAVGHRHGDVRVAGGDAGREDPAAAVALTDGRLFVAAPVLDDDPRVAQHGDVPQRIAAYSDHVRELSLR